MSGGPKVNERMIYRYLGNSGLKVSILSFGTMLAEYNEETIAAWKECAKAAFEAGINYFDSAELYGWGQGDEMLGDLLQETGWAREDYVVAVKHFNGAAPNRAGLSRKKIIESTKLSLKKMKLKYCDLVFAHRWETDCPLEETCKAYNWLVEKGLALYWCTSEWPQDLITDAIKLCDKKGWHRPIADQCEYNVLIRKHLEQSNVRLFENYGYGTTIWSPLGGGFLTGKYNDGNIPEDSRYAKNAMFKNFAWDKYIGGDKREKIIKLLAGLKEYSEELGVTQAELVLAWTLVNKDVSTCIIGASRLSQLESNLKSVDLATKWTQEIEDKMSEILSNQPDPRMNWLNWVPNEPRRKFSLKLDMELGTIEYKDPNNTYLD